MKDRSYKIAINLKYDGYQIGLASMIYQAFDKKTGLGVSINEELAQELHNSVVKTLKKRKV